MPWIFSEFMNGRTGSRKGGNRDKSGRAKTKKALRFGRAFISIDLPEADYNFLATSTSS